MKAVMIIYNQAITEKVDYLLDFLEIRGYSKWQDVKGRGTISGTPHLGTHTWPEMNSAIMAVVEDDKVQLLMQNIKKLNSVNEEIGIRAFVWEVIDLF
jgi:nitrogen regulatory protein PII